MNARNSETLEDYQNSIREFKERSRYAYESFILSKGEDRQKLQLRLTPYTDKKGGYGCNDLDHGLAVFREQQKRIDELEQRLHNIYMNAESNCCDSCKFAESEAMSVGCGF